MAVAAVGSNPSAVAEPGGAKERWTPLRVFWWAFVGFLVLGIGWGLAVPYDGFADEARHVARAYSAAGGQLVFHGDLVTVDTQATGGPAAGTPLIKVPRSLAPNAPSGSACFQQDPGLAASCSPPAGRTQDEHTIVEIPSGAGYYNPIYYVIVGQPLRLWPNSTGIYLARLLSDAMVSALFAAAFAITAMARRGRRMLAGLLVALTPVAINLAPAINPAGLEIGGAAVLWTALVLLVDGRQRSANLVRLASLGAAIVATVRFGGILWLALIVGVAALGMDRDRLRRLTRLRLVRRWGTFVAVAVAAGALWTLWQDPAGDAVSTSGDRSLAYKVFAALSVDTWDRGEYLVKGMVGLVGFGETSPPAIVFPVWFCAFGALLFTAVVLTRRLDRIRLGILVIGTFGVLIASDVGPISQGWYLSQGRYGLPAILGVPILGAYLLVERGVFSEAHLRTLTRAYVLLLLPLQLLTFYTAMLRYQQGLKGGNPLPVQPWNPFVGSWLPASGPELPLAAAVIGLAVLGWLVWRMTPPQPEPALANM
ncbi:MULTISPECIES: DUF2142 domain-containing protein [Streptacidiphilus]|uniref:DUF2142 domain-containing protein n=2 Tax=Streptacidiphilus TaxID=228398 RepID=A0ABV6UKH7_9ACTN|nr:DUF2142 domain-containing protein [Streptacidiphilus jeojiense]